MANKIRPAGLYFLIIFTIATVSMAVLGLMFSESRTRISKITEGITATAIPSSLERIRLSKLLLEIRNEAERAMFADEAATRNQAYFLVTSMRDHKLIKSDLKTNELLNDAIQIIESKTKENREAVASRWSIMDSSIAMYSSQISESAFEDITGKLGDVQLVIDKDKTNAVYIVAGGTGWQFLLLIGIYFIFVRPLLSIEKEADGLEDGSIFSKMIIYRIREMNSLREAVNRLHLATKENKEMSKAVEAEMHKARVNAEERGEFLSTMSHEIKTPLAAINGMIFAVERTGLNTEQKQYIGRMAKAAHHLHELVSRILAMSRMDANKLDLIEDEFKIEELVDEVSRMVDSIIEKKRLRFEVSIDKNVPILVMGDRLRIAEILINYLNNAIKYTSTGTIGLDIRCKSNINGNAEIMLAVSDTGEGIDEENMVMLFRRFSQFENRRFGGSGLGLSISKGLAELMGGTVGVESIKGVGSKFWATVMVKVPKKNTKAELQEKVYQGFESTREISREDGKLDTSQILSDIYHMASSHSPQATHLWLENERSITNANEEAGSKLGDLFRKYKLKEASDYIRRILKDQILEPSQSSFKVESPSILIIDDTPGNIDLMFTLLKDIGSVKASTDPDRGIEIASSLVGKSIIVLDVSMPTKSGYEVIKELKANPLTSQIDVIMISASESKEIREKCLNLGAIEFIDRGMPPEELRNSVITTLHGE